MVPEAAEAGVSRQRNVRRCPISGHWLLWGRLSWGVPPTPLGISGAPLMQTEPPCSPK